MNGKPELSAGIRALLAKAGRKGGKRGRGPVKSEAAHRGWQIRKARAEALKRSQVELVAISREIGSFLDGLHLTGADEERRKEFCDRLYSILQVAKVKVGS